MKTKFLLAIVFTGFLLLPSVKCQVAINMDGSLPATNSILHVKGVAGNNFFINTNSGNVGIGTLTPSTLLHIKAQFNTPDMLTLQMTSGGGITDMARINFTNNNDNAIRAQIAAYQDHTSDNRAVGLTFDTRTISGVLTEAMRITSSGLVGIGVTSPTQQLDVGGNIHLSGNVQFDLNKEARFPTGRILSLSVPNRMVVESFQSGQDLWLRGPGGIQFYSNGDRMRINNNGNVGVNTTNPSTLLHIKANNGYPDLLTLQMTSGGGITDMARINFTNNNDNATRAQIAAYQDHTSDNRAVGLTFDTRTISGVLTEAMRITSSGLVGIGVTSPTQQLDVGGNIHLSGNVQFDLNKEARFPTGRILSLSVPNRMVVESFQSGQDLWLRGPGGIQFYSNGDRMRITNTGEVGIGTNAPAAKLEVVGGVKVGNDGSSCSSTNAGTIRYNSENLEFCDGSSWKQLSTAASNMSVPVIWSGYCGSHGRANGWNTYCNDHVDFNTAPSYITTDGTGNFTIHQDGYYRINFWCITNTTYYGHIRLLKNGAVFYYGHEYVNDNLTDNFTDQTWPFEEGDVLTIEVYNYEGSSNAYHSGNNQGAHSRVQITFEGPLN